LGRLIARKWIGGIKKEGDYPLAAETCSAIQF
jgi:hypothetical protein